MCCRDAPPRLSGRQINFGGAVMGSATVLYLHGGGMVVGSVPIFDGPVSRYVARTGVPMLSVPYRRASEVSSQPDDGSFSNCHRPS